MHDSSYILGEIAAPNLGSDLILISPLQGLHPPHQPHLMRSEVCKFLQKSHDEDAHILLGEKVNAKYESFLRWSSDKSTFQSLCCCCRTQTEKLPPIAHYRFA
jgi:hypothetical protein